MYSVQKWPLQQIMCLRLCVHFAPAITLVREYVRKPSVAAFHRPYSDRRRSSVGRNQWVSVARVRLFAACSRRRDFVYSPASWLTPSWPPPGSDSVRLNPPKKQTSYDRIPRTCETRAFVAEGICCYCCCCLSQRRGCCRKKILS